MVEFNRVPGTQSPDNLTGRSQGIQTTFRNDALGQLFQGIASFGEQVVEGVDNVNKENIRNQIYEQVDAIQDEVGVGDATLFQEDTPERDPLPSQLSSSGENLDRLQAAYESGALKESHYWARLNSMVRQLRQKYPGYREEIDQMVSSVTGAQPANALRNALFNEWEANKANDPNKRMNELVDWATRNGRLPPDYLSRQEQGQPYSFNELTAHVSHKQREEAERQDRRAAMAEKADFGTMNTTDAKRSFSMDTAQYINTSLHDATKAIGNNWEVINNRVNDMMRSAEAGAPMDQAGMDTIRAQISQLKLQLGMGANQLLTESWNGDPNNTYNQWMTPQESQAIIDQAMMPVTLIEQALVDENWGMLRSVTAWLEATKNDNTRHMLQNVPVLQSLSAVKDLLGPEGFAIYLGASPQISDAVAQALIDFESSRAMTDPTASITQSFAQGETNDLPTEYYNGLTDRWTKLIDQVATGKLPPEVFARNVDYMFGPESLAVLEQLDDPSRFEYFKKVASPRVTSQMLKLREQGDLESWENYQQWVTNSFLVLFQSKVATLQAVPTSLFAPGMGVAWDDANSGFRLVGTPATAGLGIGAAIGTADIRNAQDTIKELNDVIRVVKPIIEDADGEVGPDVYELLRQMGYNPEDQENLVSILMKSIAELFGEEDDAEGLSSGGGTADQP